MLFITHRFMDHLIAALPPGSRVLDLGARAGSFQTERSDLHLVRLDLEIPAARHAGAYVAADAARMPILAQCFDLIVSNHSLEHFPELERTVSEIGRVSQPGGALFIAVPDAGTLTDRIYRWLGQGGLRHGGGHVNAFRSPGQVIGLVQKLTGMKCRGTRVLFSGLSFLNARNVTHPPGRLLLFANGNERFLAALTWGLRTADLLFGTRLSQYGWEFYFGNAAPVDSAEWWANVCVRCGAGHSEAFLRLHTPVQRRLRFWESYRCPGCGGWNLLTRD
jgi:SAM-dependent methyltransferase